MQPAFPTSRLLPLLVAVLLGVSLVPFLSAQPALAANNVQIGDRTITITMLIEVAGGNQALIDRWEAALNHYWNTGPDGKPFQWCGMEVNISVDFELLPEDAASSGEDHHLVAAGTRRPGHHSIATVRGGGDRAGYDPSRHNAVGYLPTPGQENLSPSQYDVVIAHEFGHFLGLSDEYQRVGDPDERRVLPDPEHAPEYEWNDRNSNGRLDPGEVRLRPGETGSLMAGDVKGQVLQRHIDRLIERHNIDEQLECTLQVRHEAEFTWDGTFGTHSDVGRSFVVFEIEVEEGDGGRLHGQGRAVALEYEREDLYTPTGCLWKATLSESASIPDFEVSGTRNGNTVSLTLPENLDANFLGDGVSTCSGSTKTSNLKLPYLREISGELINGRFEETTVEEIPRPNWIPVTARTDVLIEEQTKPK